MMMYQMISPATNAGPLSLLPLLTKAGRGDDSGKRLLTGYKRRASTLILLFIRALSSSPGQGIGCPCLSTASNDVCQSGAEPNRLFTVSCAKLCRPAQLR